MAAWSGRAPRQGIRRRARSIHGRRRRRRRPPERPRRLHGCRVELRTPSRREEDRVVDQTEADGEDLPDRADTHRHATDRVWRSNAEHSCLEITSNLALGIDHPSWAGHQFHPDRRSSGPKVRSRPRGVPSGPTTGPGSEHQDRWSGLAAPRSRVAGIEIVLKRMPAHTDQIGLALAPPAPVDQTCDVEPPGLWGRSLEVPASPCITHQWALMSRSHHVNGAAVLRAPPSSKLASLCV